ncbi:replication protein RepA [Xanthomonas campestris pv. raphani]|uniref:replication protein RepA n=2 Tax=Xanthomonas TaxID=338 RepID=UPI002B2392AA|nr:replication protein RepA [Xanthomonas campestris]MEA9749388.1 replication protein RepA [Xanthomonas campestris pv. raphani]
MSKDTGTLDLFKGVRDTEVAMIIAQCAVTFGTDSSQFRDLVERINSGLPLKELAIDVVEAPWLAAELGKQTARERRVKENQAKFIAEAVAIEAEAAQEAGMLGFMARVLVQATMPHSKPDSNEYSRKNGTLQVSIMAPSQIGLPYGSYPRLLLAWLTTEAVRTKSPTLHLGDTLTEFMNKLDLNPTGGRWGNITALKEQANRLFGSSVVAYDDVREKSKSARHVRGSQIIVADDWDLWWDPRQVKGEDAGQNGLFSSWVKLSEKFYNQVTDRPVPIDLRAIRALKRSPLALDLYSWSTYRVSYLNKRTEIPWEALQMQFGANYADDAAGQGRRDFKKKLLQALTKVRTVYPELRAQEGDRGLVMLPSPTHVLAKK